MLQPLLRWERLGRLLSRALLVGAASSVIMIGWHVPFMFEAASRNLPTWILKEVLLLVSGLLLWWPVAGPLPGWRPAFPVQMIYLFTIRIPMVILGTFYTFDNNLIYLLRSFALDICAPSSISDQQAGGLVMSVVGGMIGFGTLTIVFFNWFRSSNAAELH
jgi:putative membrane protein